MANDHMGHTKNTNGGPSADGHSCRIDIACAPQITDVKPSSRRPRRIWAAALVSVVAICLAYTFAVLGTQPAQSPFAPDDASDSKASAPAYSSQSPHAATNEQPESSDSSPQADAQVGELDYRPVDDPEDFSGADFVTGVVLVSFKDGANPQDALAQLETETGITNIGIVEAASGVFELTLPEDVSVKDAKGLFARSTVVDSAQPNFVYRTMSDNGGNTAPSTAYGELQAGLTDGLGVQGIGTNDPFKEAGEGDVSTESRQWWLKSVHADEAWGIIKTDGAVTVAVMDNVINTDHEDLVGNIVKDASGSPVALNAVTKKMNDDMAGSSYTGSDSRNHGTHVAGIVAARANNAIGIAGASYNARILPIRAADDRGDFTTSGLLYAYEYVIANKQTYNIRVVNFSIGAYSSSENWADDALIKKIDEAWDAGIVTVTAACNAYGGYEVPFACYPGDYEKCVNVISLQNTSDSDPTAVSRAATSNYNVDEKSRAKDISAPGASIFSTVNGSSGYGNLSGTSMAAPCVSGILALIFAGNPSLSPADAVDVLYSTATDLGPAGFDSEYGYGEVNALKAVQYLKRNLDGATSTAVGESTALVFEEAQTGTWTWTSSDSGIVELSGDNKGVTVRGIAPGTVTINGTNGKSTAAATVSVYDTALQDASVAFGSTLQLQLPSGNPAGSWTWTSSDGDIATVGSSTGVVTSKTAGAVTVTATLASNPLVKATANITVTKARIGDASITMPKTSYEYTGNAIAPLPTVRIGSLTLRKDVDYALGYSSNVNAGTAYVTITGVGANVTGSASKAFSITPANISSTTMSIAPSSLVYSGKALTPSVSLTGSNRTTVSPVNYSIKYSSNVAAGIGYITVVGTGNYTGSKTGWFTIRPASISSATLARTAFVYNGSAFKPAASVRSGTKALRGGSDYVIDYSKNVNAGTGVASIRGVNNYTGSLKLSFSIAKVKNSLVVKAKSSTVKYAKVRKAKQVVKRANALVVSKARGTLAYTKLTGSKYLTVSKTTGNVTVKKGAPRGTHSIKARVRAAGTMNYKAATKIVTVKVRVK